MNVDEMDADAVQEDWNDDDEWRGTEEERKRKVDAYMDEVMNRLGFSGIVSLLNLLSGSIYMQILQTSHMPTRFHYTSTAPENYGLTPAEILLATDAELNSYVGLKKLAPYRVDKGQHLTVAYSFVQCNLSRWQSEEELGPKADSAFNGFPPTAAFQGGLQARGCLVN